MVTGRKKEEHAPSVPNESPPAEDFLRATDRPSMEEKKKEKKKRRNHRLHTPHKSGEGTKKEEKKKRGKENDEKAMINIHISHGSISEGG